MYCNPASVIEHFKSQGQKIEKQDHAHIRNKDMKIPNMQDLATVIQNYATLNRNLSCVVFFCLTSDK